MIYLNPDHALEIVLWSYHRLTQTLVLRMVLNKIFKEELLLLFQMKFVLQISSQLCLCLKIFIKISMLFVAALSTIG